MSNLPVGYPSAPTVNLQSVNTGFYPLPSPPKLPRSFAAHAGKESPTNYTTRCLRHHFPKSTATLNGYLQCALEPTATVTAFATTNYSLPTDLPQRVYVYISMLTYLPVGYAHVLLLYTASSCHLGIDRALLLWVCSSPFFFWWVNMGRWWHRPMCTRLLTNRSAGLPFPSRYQTAPVSPSVSITLDLYQLRRGVTLYNSLSRTASVIAPTNEPPLKLALPPLQRISGQYHRLLHPSRASPVTLLPDIGLQFCSFFSDALLERQGINKTSTSSHDPSTNDGVKFVSHTIAESL